MIQFNKKHLTVAVLTVLLLGAAYAGFYFLILDPMEVQKGSYRDNIRTSEELLAAAEGGGGNAAVLNQYSLAELQMEVPNNRFEEQFLLDLEKAEVLSGSKVTSAVFADQEFTDETAEQQQEAAAEEQADEPAAEPAAEAPPAEDDPEEAAEQTPEGEPASDEPSLPAGMQKVTMTVSLESGDYEGVKRFLSTLETVRRITQVESVTLANPESGMLEETDEEPLTYDVIVSAYYLPSLEELKEQLPPFPKTNPGSVIDPFESPSDENIGETSE
ncbi:hypothetical protein GKZ89_06085 [Bacillus mangrovi]|uniref:Pilus assembly protein PilO n=1 Tax=Metabacillus mangrovi TaxID=1491830 RepID=A0A7X2S3F2_9BACI|nr:hypothetical protein [Metabacillus mangrovi]MTH52974.1 hypothetical protein [Metabacillus mangrovi]